MAEGVATRTAAAQGEEGSLILAIDPGPTESAWVLWNGRLLDFGKDDNGHVLAVIRDWRNEERCVIEQVASYGMPVGAEVFETVYWSGRFAQAFGADRVSRIPRLQIKMHVCHNSRANDGNIRQALIDRFGRPGTKKQPGLLYGVTKDVWAALAVAVTWWDQHAQERVRKGA